MSTEHINIKDIESLMEKILSKSYFPFKIRPKKVSSKQRKLQIWSSAKHQYFTK
jgi:hypothetical protein